jgi:protein TonB
MNNNPALATADIDDLLFLNRNKKYGAYELRKNYDKRLTVAVLAAVSFFIMLLVGLGYIPKPKMPENIITCYMSEPPVRPIEVEVEKDKIKSTNHPRGVKGFHLVVTKDQQQNIDTTKMTGLTGMQGTLGGLFGDNEGTDPDGPDLGGTLTKVKAEKSFDPSPDQDAEFPGGEKAYENYLKSNIKYPTFAVDNGIEGIITLSLKIDEAGNVVDVKAEKKIGGGCDDEAIRVIRSMPRWKPGRKNGEMVPVIRHVRVIMLLK